MFLGQGSDSIKLLPSAELFNATCASGYPLLLLRRNFPAKIALASSNFIFYSILSVESIIAMMVK